MILLALIQIGVGPLALWSASNDPDPTRGPSNAGFGTSAVIWGVLMLIAAVVL